MNCLRPNHPACQNNQFTLLASLLDVRLFCETFGHTVEEFPVIPDPKTQVRRAALIREEYGEFTLAWDDCATALRANWQLESQQKALAELADALADLIYVIHGCALQYGIPLHLVWQAVQNANMSKLWTYSEAASLPTGWTAKMTELEDNQLLLDKTTDQYRAYVVHDDTGKVRKPPSWKEPDILGIIKAAMAKE